MAGVGGSHVGVRGSHLGVGGRHLGVGGSHLGVEGGSHAEGEGSNVLAGGSSLSAGGAGGHILVVGEGNTHLAGVVGSLFVYMLGSHPVVGVNSPKEGANTLFGMVGGRSFFVIGRGSHWRG